MPDGLRASRCDIALSDFKRRPRHCTRQGCGCANGVLRVADAAPRGSGVIPAERGYWKSPRGNGVWVEIDRDLTADDVELLSLMTRNRDGVFMVIAHRGALYGVEVRG